MSTLIDEIKESYATAQGYDSWDMFITGRSRRSIKPINKTINDLMAELDRRQINQEYAQSNIDIIFLEEMGDRLEKYRSSRDVGAVEYLEKMIEDWRSQLMDRVNEVDRRYILKEVDTKEYIFMTELAKTPIELHNTHKRIIGFIECGFAIPTAIIRSQSQIKSKI